MVLLYMPRYPGTLVFGSLQFESDSVHISDLTWMAIIITNLIVKAP